MHNTVYTQNRLTVLLSLILFVWIGTTSVEAQNNDSSYVEASKHEIGIGITLSQNFIQLSNLSPDFDKTYRSNLPLRIGLKINLRNTSLYFGYGSKMDFLTSRNGGKSTALAFELNHYDRHFNYHLDIEHYKGFHSHNPKLMLYPKLAIGDIDVSAEYIANSHFSYEAARELNKRQRVSSGSFLAGILIGYSHISNDQPMNFTVRDGLRMRVNAGYAYTWVISRHWFLTPQIIGCLTIGSENNKPISTKKFIAYPTVQPSAILGYTLHNFSFGASYRNDIETIDLAREKHSLMLNGQFELSFTFHFGTIGKKYLGFL